MHYSFYAHIQDRLDILDYIFTKTDLQVFDMNSKINEEIKEYKTIDEIIQNNPEILENNKLGVYFRLWSPRLGRGIKSGEPKPYKTTMNENVQKEKGWFFRYRFDGLGLISISFEGSPDPAVSRESSIGHLTKERALGIKVAKALKEDVCANGWNWKEIYATGRQLKSHIHNKMAVRKLSTSNFGVLKQMNEEVAKGNIELYPDWLKNYHANKNIV